MKSWKVFMYRYIFPSLLTHAWPLYHPLTLHSSILPHFYITNRWARQVWICALWDLSALTSLPHSAHYGSLETFSSANTTQNSTKRMYVLVSPPLDRTWQRKWTSLICTDFNQPRRSVLMLISLSNDAIFIGLISSKIRKK